jgi:hypothetical protein
MSEQRGIIALGIHDQLGIHWRERDTTSLEVD